MPAADNTGMLTTLSAKRKLWLFDMYIQIRVRRLYPQPRSHLGSYDDKVVYFGGGDDTVSFPVYIAAYT